MSAIALLFASLLFAQPNPDYVVPYEFTKSVRAAKMTFERPQGFRSIEPVANPHFLYTHAITSAVGVEVRFRIDSLVDQRRRYERCRTDLRCSAAAPDLLPAAVHMATTRNIASKVLKSEAAPKSLLAALNAQSGRIAFVVPKASFATGYNRAIVVVAKRGLAYATTVMLIRDDKVDPQELAALKSLRFK